MKVPKFEVCFFFSFFSFVIYTKNVQNVQETVMNKDFIREIQLSSKKYIAK